jgi:hypothetical protein
VPNARSRYAPLVAASLALASAATGCSPQGYLAIMPGVLNDPGNRTLRRELLAFGTKRLCEEASKRSLGLKLQDEDPAIGRFYAKQCAAQELDRGDLFLQFGGAGFAWSNVSGRIGFNASASVQFAQDFQLDGSTMYVYFRPVQTAAKRFDLVMVERPSTIAAMGALVGSPDAFVARVGEGLLAHQIGRGFTVVRESSGEVSFASGLLPVGQRPSAAFERTSDGRTLVANERVELHQNQRDYLGPIDITEDGDAIYLTLAVDGAPAVDVQIHARGAGEPWLQQYATAAQAGPPTSPPLFDDAVIASPTPYRRALAVPRGQYYVVLDHTASAGRTMPPTAMLDDRAALVSVGIEVGDAP